jgi:urease accessory protein
MKKYLLLGLPLSFFAIPAMAHTAMQTSGFWSGFTHPFSGWDHLITMLFLGIWLANLNKALAVKSALFSVSVFALGIIAGGFLPSSAIAIVELSVILSGIIVGLLVAFKVRLGQLAPIVAATLMSVHGLVHGVEVTANVYGYTLGACTSMLVLLGVAYFATFYVKSVQRLAGRI